MKKLLESEDVKINIIRIGDFVRISKDFSTIEGIGGRYGKVAAIVLDDTFPINSIAVLTKEYAILNMARVDCIVKLIDIEEPIEELKEQISYWFNAEHFNSSDFEDGNHVVLNISLVEPINDSFKTVMEFMR